MSTQVIIAIGWIGTSLLTGVLGIVLGPWIRYRIFHSHARSVEQRQMMEAWLDMTRQQSGYFLSAVIQVREGKSVRQAALNCCGALMQWRKDTEAVTRYPWEPVRVVNKKLRELFEELTEVKTHLLLYTTEVANNGRGAGFVETIQRDVNETERLRKAILEQMAKADL